MYIAARVIIVVTLVYYIISSCITAFSCTPRDRIWNPLITDGHCLDNNALVLVTCVFNIVSDVTILLLPTRVVWKLQLPRKKKIGIVLLFGIGSLACVANVMIIYYATLMSGQNSDVSYNAAWFGCWVYAEISLGIIVTCTISLPKFVEAKGAAVRQVFSQLVKPLKSFPSIATLVYSTKTQSSKIDAISQDQITDSQTHSDSDLVSHHSGHDVEANQVPYRQAAVAMTQKGLDGN